MTLGNNFVSFFITFISVQVERDILPGHSIAAVVPALVILAHIGDSQHTTFHLGALVGNATGLAPPPEEVALWRVKPAEEVNAGAWPGSELLPCAVAVVAV